MSKMGLLGAIGFSLALVSLTQIPYCAEGCKILSVTPTGPSSILVKWVKQPGATNYFLDLRVKNNTDFAPVVVTLPATVTEKDVQGLRPGTEYSVTLKVFQFYFVECVVKAVGSTVPDTSQIVAGWALTSSSVMVKWTEVPSADHYYLLVRLQATEETFNLTLTNSTTVVGKLKPSTNYDFYVYTVNQAGLGGRSKVRTITTLKQPPGGITATQTGRGTVRVTWQLVKDVLMYYVTIEDTEDPNSGPSAYNVTDTKLDVQGVLPCSTYLISVSSYSKFLVPSEPAEYTYTSNKLTPVSSVLVDYTCTTHTVIVSWSAVFGADSYKATAIGENSTHLMCTSQSTSCQITNLSCGQNYMVHVTPMSAGCKNMVNTTSATFQTVPCPPEKLELLRDCSSEIIIFSWEHTNNTDHYKARAVDSRGVVQECLTEDNSCYFTHTMCGRHYYFTVYSITGQCSSHISSTVDIRTAPCIPQNMQTSANCDSDVLLSKWDLAEGALRYTVEAFGNRGNNSRYNCTSLSNSCAIEGVNCGEYLTIYITAFDDECASPRTLGPVAETVPCTPQTPAAVKECGADSVTMTWNLFGSALFYVAMVKDGNGVIHSCNSMDLTCKIEGLKCSTNYTAYVIASNFMCNSSESKSITIETAACPPDHVSASLDCAANEAMISWHGQTRLNSYTATIVDENQGLLSCSSTTTSCKIPNLKCGQLYTVTVCHHDGICPSMPSEAVYMESVACGPYVTSHLDCQSQVLSISWNASSKAQGYITVISDGNKKMSYNTTKPTLSVKTLECGQDYTVKVMSFNSTCVSRPTLFPVQQTPCVPTNVVAKSNCGQSFMDITWNASHGALYYQVAALDKDGHQLLCSSSETLCRLEGLKCSQVYNVGVSASDNNCTSNESSAVTVRTAPCPPSQLNTSVNCDNNSAMLTWNSSPNAVSYTGRAESTDGHSVTCDAGTKLGCQLEGLQCGKKYTFTVSASDGNCQSNDSEPVVRTTAPCVVQDVLNTMNCSTNALIISWVPGLMAVNYSATILAGNGTTFNCITEASSCTMANLQCGQQYSVAVTAVSSTCKGPSSAPEIVSSVPCVPMNIQGVVECSSNTLQASWTVAAGAVSYISTLTGVGGFFASCHTANQSCLFPGLQCAHTYMLSVAALNNRCNSSQSAKISVMTAPCEPTNVAAVLNCISDVVTVTWSASAGARNYTVVAEANGHVDSCNSTSTSCTLAQLHCGEDYTVTVLAGDGTCNSTIHANTNVTTAPCAPVIQDHSLDCVSNNALVSWTEDKDSMSITINATSNLGHSTSCSSTTNSSCVLRDLRCGNTYTVQAVAQGVQCLSKPSSTFQIVTAPCTPANVGYTYSCGTGIAFLSWDETLGRKSFYAQIQSEDHVFSCSTTQTDCPLPSMLCGHLYEARVISAADHCNSSVPGVTQIQTAPCAPMNVSASLVCDNNTAAVSWLHSPGAVSYTVTAHGRDGDVKQCTTNGTYCQLPGMHCAQTYVITVTPFSNRCKGSDSYPHTYIAGPCPPTDVHVSLQCVGNVGLVTWTAALQADLYVATAVPSAVDDHAHSCTSSGTSCSLADLHCGEMAVVTVVTIERGCQSKPSLPFTFHSVICPPPTVTGDTSCKNNDITVSWDRSPESGATYVIHSQKDGGANTNYSTAQTSHVITGLHCGDLYTLTVAAKDTQCTSVPSKPIHTETAPCPPTNLTARADCGTNLGTLTWAASTHAIYYTAKVTGTHGHVVSCSSNATTCSVKLDCGHQYSAFVVASSATCYSSKGDTLIFDSAPCLPDGVVAELDCKVNSFAVQWRGSIGDVGSYTAIAIGSDGTRATCDTTNTNCTIKNLKCGLTYSIVVTTPSVDCGTIEGSNYRMQSAPCKPSSVLVNLQCSTNVASVTWRNSGPNQTQVVSTVNSRGVTTTCNSSSSTCTMDQLECGESYVISVVGHTNTCSSEPALAERLNTAPCVPTHLTARVDCQTGITSYMGVTWDAARGARSYTVYARGSLGYDAECNSTDTNCHFLNLACGQDYSITVVARHDTCVSLVSKSINATTGPCPHSGLKTTLDCNTNTAAVSWMPGSGNLYYNASADAFAITHQMTCSTDGSACNISSLRCGESYRVSVSGQGHNCPSPAQDWHRINTAPCPPTQLMVNSSCDSNSILVSWQASQGSVTYMAVAEDAHGRQWFCNTSSTTCQIPALLCGQQYQVYAIGLDEKCIGAKSNIEVIHTAPCMPENVQINLNCLSGFLNITWKSTGYAPQFHASVVSSNGHVSICKTNEHHCVVHNMQCGLTYNITVVAHDEACNSSHSPIKQVITAPCPVTSYIPALDCNTGIVSVTWTNSVAGVVYTVSAIDTTGRRHNCSSTTNCCDFSTLECGTQYNITITPSRNGCVGRDSLTKTVTTVPCIPHLSNVEIDCLTNSAWVMWEEAAGIKDYVVLATNSHGDVQTFECNSTSDGMCALPPLICSQNLTFTLKAQNQQCLSAPSNAVTTETGPCPPVDVEKSVSCDNRTVSISWEAIPGAVTYTATLENINGDSTCCSTSDTGCNVTNLPCGEFYVLLVTAEGRTCNSSQSSGDIVKTVPCVPDNLKANLSCSDNVASMSWNYSRGGQLYKVRAVSPDGHVDECTSHENHCDLTGLHCGQHYTAYVMAEDRDCRSKPSDSVKIKTVPCTPANVSSVVDCQTNSLMVSWPKSLGADSYLTTVQDSNGQTTTCQDTTNGSCNVTGLGCGQIYHVSVVSSDGYCNSPPTNVVDTPSVPCKPRHIKAVMDCYTQMAVVSWYPSDGALSYVVVASTTSGHNITCETNTTYCDLEWLLCGQSYSVSVEAVGKTCSRIVHMTGKLVTEPCIPKHINTQYSLTIGQVLWDMSAGADYYTVEGVTEWGLTVSCITNDTYCALYNMQCGQMYNINVLAHNHVCQDVSISKEPVMIKTEPCPPNNVQTDVQCQNDTGVVTWEASFGAVGYEARLAGRDGHSLSCHTSDTFCNIEDLHCGVVYYTNVIAIGKTLNSSVSTTVLLVSAPCAARNVAVNVDCCNNTAAVSWSLASGASSYLVTAVSADGSWASCETGEHHCDLTELQCGHTYNISLAAISDHCQAETNTNITFSTGPCKPVHVGVDLQCGTSTANMYWEGTETVELYMATATSSMGMTLKCNSTNSTCQFSNLHCGETYEFSVTAYSNMCYSQISSTAEVQTEPCQPADLTVEGSCYNETVVLDWLTAKGALVYEVTATGDLGYITSFQTNDTMIEAELPCGQLFTFTVKAQDNHCDSAESQPQEFKTGPCVPQHVQAFTHCENNLGSVSWAKSDGADSYLAIAVGQNGHTHMCSTNTTSCTWDDLHCSEHYTIHVIANDYLCSSMPSNGTLIRMAPCIPKNLKSSLNCTTKVGSLSWNASETAAFYIVTAETNSGHKVQLSTNDTWTYISEFLCGQEYFLSVQAVDTVCTSRPSVPSKLMSEPCPPTGISSFMNCLSNIAVVSWTGSAGGAQFYTATVTQEDGQSQSCWSDSEQCGMPNVHCGQNYTVTVIASNEKCNSDPSEADTLQSVPCVPTDVNVTMDCSKNQVLVSWNASKGALSYKVTAQSTQGGVSTCESTDLMCILTNLTCGQAYAVQVVAQDDICSSLPSPATKFKSVPCTPKIGSVVLDCFTNSALLDWDYAEGAVYYIATAQSSSGHVSTCSSNFTNCELNNLQCSQTYNVITVASNGKCDSPPSSRLQVASVPCPPEDVSVILNCSTNTALVEWQASKGADSYTVQAFGLQEHESVCETDSKSCILLDLLCGFTYNITVIAVNSQCNVSQSDTKQLQAAPCAPQQLEARVVCESGAVVVSWEPSRGALSYITVAQGNGGYESTCNTTNTTCLFHDLMCGLNYSITVRALDETCDSAESSVVEINKGSCVPQKVTAHMVCSNDTGVMSWEEGEDVSSYMVQAFGPSGHKIQCNNTESSCELPNMQCGQLYNLTVTAQDGQCDNSHAYLNLHSVPCRPTNVKASLLCRSNSAAVTWEPASGALSYLAVGVTADGGHQIECNNTITHCDLSSLQCGQTYNVSVFSRDDSCSSVESDEAYVWTAPCAPQNVTVDAQCDNGAMVVSWSSNPTAQYFHVAAVSNTGAKLYCKSSGTVCTIKNIPCGRSYNVTVLSVRDNCESKPSATVLTSSAPCVPRNTKGRLDCVSNSAWVTWDASEGALSYFVLAQGAGGHNSSCTTTSSPCNVPNLKCGTLYTFHVTAVNKHCHSNNSSTFELETGPCALTSISAVTQCNSDTILVEWKLTQDTPLYLVTAEGHDQTLISCNSSSNSCALQDIHCGMHYSIIVSSSSDKCSSLRSPPKKIKTAPCVPDKVTVVPSCEENGATVTWAHSPVATSYQLTATGRDGHVTKCNTSVNNCILANLHCGQPYSLSITASGDNCTSPPSTASFRTVPCEPSSLAVDIECETNSAILSWDSSEGAIKYFGFASSTDGHPFYCDSTSNSCTIKDLQCGQIYNFSIEASDGICNSSYSAHLQAGAAPCAPTGLNVQMQKSSQTYWAMMSWDSVNCSSVEYLVEMTGRIQNNPQALMEVCSYWWPRNYFEFQMPCSTAYNITVRSRNSAGSSKPSRALPGVTAPCAPQNVKYSGNRQSAVLSWETSVFATRYIVYNVSSGGHVEVCNTTALSCSLTNFDPQTIEVTASNAVGESSPTSNITGPIGTRRRRDLRATQVYANLDKDLEIPELLTVTPGGVALYVKWMTVTDATEYTLVIEEEQREQQASQPPRVITVEGDFYIETDLRPWTTYCVRLAAKNTVSQSDYSRPTCRTTGA